MSPVSLYDSRLAEPLSVRLLYAQIRDASCVLCVSDLPGSAGSGVRLALKPCSLLPLRSLESSSLDSGPLLIIVHRPRMARTSHRRGFFCHSPLLSSGPNGFQERP
jgi:hypothetical protein